MGSLEAPTVSQPSSALPLTAEIREVLGAGTDPTPAEGPVPPAGAVPAAREWGSRGVPSPQGCPGPPDAASLCRCRSCLTTSLSLTT